MNDGHRSLEHELRALSTAVAWPDAPDVTAAVRERIEATGRPRRRVGRRELAIALAVLAAAVVATMSVPQARSAVLRWFGIGSVRVELVDELPAAAPREDMTLLGPILSRADAAAVFGGPLLRFDDTLGPPDEIRALDAPREASYLWFGPDGRVRLLVSELPGTLPDTPFVKVAGDGVQLDWLRVDGRRALWITGDAHGFGLVDGDFTEIRLAGSTLLVERGGTTIRIEGDLDRREAIDVYRAIE